MKYAQKENQKKKYADNKPRNYGVSLCIAHNSQPAQGYDFGSQYTQRLPSSDQSQGSLANRAHKALDVRCSQLIQMHSSLKRAPRALENN